MNNVIVIIGPTAVGKTSLSLKLAKELNGEIISADSMQVYKGLNIGTAKLTSEEMQGIPHHLIDILNFNEKYNAWCFVNDCRRKIDEIISRKHTPIIVGGTNLYVTALIKNYKFNEQNSEEVYKNKYDISFQVYICNIEPRSKLYDRINARVDVMLAKGLLDEVKNLKKDGLNKNSQAGKSIGYREILEFLDGNFDYDYAVEKIKQNSRNFAKRQLTWLRSMTDVVWLNGEEENKNINLIIKNYK